MIHEALPELTPYSYVVTPITVPSVMAFPPDSVRPGTSFGTGDVTMQTFTDTYTIGQTTVEFILRLHVSRTQDAQDQDLLDSYISPDGDKSILRLFEMNPTLDGACADCQVVDVRNYGNWPVAGVNYLGVEILLKATT
jgi:hypothetical protein